jgi:uncharacterized protein YjbJ (UPF0337 family)
LKGVKTKKFAELTEDDLLFDEGKKTKGKLQQKLGKTEKEIKSLLINLQCMSKNATILIDLRKLN